MARIGMPTLVSLASRTPAQIPVALAIFCAVSALLLILGAFAVPETRGNMG